MALNDDALVARFEDGTLPVEAFPHREHVRAAWIYVRRYGMPDALTEFPRALRHFATAKGTPTLYHATITWAYLLLVAERQARTPAASWDEFASANADLLTWKPSVLDRYYAPDTLWSDFARAHYVMPDRTLPLDFRHG